jgi:hypothetical protein
LYNEAVQKVLIDKVNTTFLRDTSFSNLNNLFSTRYVKNMRSAESSKPFVIITDSEGRIGFSEPVGVDKVGKIGGYVQRVKEGKQGKKEKKPYVAADEQEFDRRFNDMVDKIASLAANTEGGVELLKKFEWKGMTCIHLK